MYSEQQTTARSSVSRLEKIAYYIFLITAVVTPFIFWPSPYVSLELVKTAVLALGTIITVILYAFVAIKEKRMILPPKSIVWLSILIVASFIVSSLFSIHPGQSLFGQGFEIGTASFLALLFVAALAAFTISARRLDRVIILYVGLAIAFLVTILVQAIRLVFGPEIMTLGILRNITSSLIGGWYSMASFAVVIFLLSFLALTFLPLTKRAKIIYWSLGVLSVLMALIVNDIRVWMMSALVFLGLTAYLTLIKPRPEGGSVTSFFKRLAWFPLIIFVIAVVLVYKSPSILGPAISKMNAGYSELSLPWQMTLDVTASTIKSYPLFGAGPNHFAQAFLAYKPAGINETNAWNAEFSKGFGLIPSMVAEQGIIGMIFWILFFVFFGIVGVKVLKKNSPEPGLQFMLVSSYSVSAFLWLMAIISVPSHAMLFYTFVFTGIFLGIAVASDSTPSVSIESIRGRGVYKYMPIFLSLLVVIAVVWGLMYTKKTIALAYFASGVKQLTVSGDAKSADQAFAKAITFDGADIYWQARVEASLAAAQQLAKTVTQESSASTSSAVAEQISTILKEGIGYADKAIEYDPTNYYNYLSLARVSEVASNIGMEGAYDNAVKAYANAASINRYNPSIYLSLASLQANNKKLDDALKTVGVSLEVKSNYLDAIFLLSQIYAAKGDLASAITAAKVATELNPANAVLHFQLGILAYNNKDYATASKSLAEAVKLEPNYANAKYFLGLSYARLNNPQDALAQFQDISATNPDNEEISLIISNIKAGKPIFADAEPPVTSTPEKRSKLPVKEKR